jgi:hypothetical protein
VEGLVSVLVIMGVIVFVYLRANWENKSNAKDLAATKARDDMFARADRISQAKRAKAEVEAMNRAKAEEKYREAEAAVEAKKKAKAEEEARKAKAEEEARQAKAAEFTAARKVFLLWAIDVDLIRLNKIAFIVSEIEDFDLYSKSNGVSQLTIEQMIEIQKSYRAGSHGEIKPPAPQIHPTQNSTRENKHLNHENINLGIFGKPSTERSESLLYMSQEERAADYDMAVTNGDSQRLQEHEDFIQSVIKGLGL